MTPVRIVFFGLLFTIPIHVFSFLYFQSLYNVIQMKAKPQPQNCAVNVSPATNTIQRTTRQETGENVVIGLAAGKDSLNGLFRFVSSFRCSNKVDDVVILIPGSELSKELELLSKDFDVKLVLFELEDLPEILRKNHPSTYRFPLLKEYLGRRKKCSSLIERYDGKGCNVDTNYKFVLMTDMRDAVFQRDPFEMFLSKTPGSLKG